MESDYQGNLPVLQTATALATSFLICKVATYLTKLSGIQGGNLPGVTAIVVILATLLPRQIGSLGPAGHTVALVLMQVKKTLQVLLLQVVSVDPCRCGFYGHELSSNKFILTIAVKVLEMSFSMLFVMILLFYFFSRGVGVELDKKKSEGTTVNFTNLQDN